jgi:hypothetical protein
MSPAMPTSPPLVIVALDAKRSVGAQHSALRDKLGRRSALTGLLVTDNFLTFMKARSRTADELPLIGPELKKCGWRGIRLESE